MAEFRMLEVVIRVKAIPCPCLLVPSSPHTIGLAIDIIYGENYHK